MTAKQLKKTSKGRFSGASGLKSASLCALAGAGVTLVLSLIASWGAMKYGDPLSLVETLSAVCVFAGAATGGAAGCRVGKGFAKGLCSGGLYLLAALLASLLSSGGGDGDTRLLMLAAAVCGALLGAGVAAGRKPSAGKRLKKYVKR